jgi:hypothetical protein
MNNYNQNNCYSSENQMQWLILEIVLWDCYAVNFRYVFFRVRNQNYASNHICTFDNIAEGIRSEFMIEWKFCASTVYI